MSHGIPFGFCLHQRCLDQWEEIEGRHPLLEYLRRWGPEMNRQADQQPCDGWNQTLALVMLEARVCWHAHQVSSVGMRMIWKCLQGWQ